MNDFQKKIQKFMNENNMNNPVENKILDLIDEIGEVSKEIYKMSGYGNKKPEFRK